MAETYGNTWWGNYWLKSLNNIDYANRIPRGKSYARKGMVKSIKIVGNQISAKVAGSRRTPYKVVLIIPPFFSEEIELLINEIIKRPALISKLLNRNLDPEILDIAENLGLKVFPKQWTDFKMQCSCPDWAVPCKHLAAVIYTISREIDNNPFLVFDMHNVNLIEELRKRGIEFEEKVNLYVPKLNELLKRRMPKDVSREMPKFSFINFSGLQNIAEPISHILPESPAFYNKGDFKEKFANEFLYINKSINKFIKTNLIQLYNVQHDTNSIDIQNNICYQLQTDGVYKLVNNFVGGYEDRNVVSSTERIEDLLLNIDKNILLSYQANIAPIHQTLQCAIQLLANGAVIPQIVRNDKNENYIRWIPAYIDSKVKAIIDQLDEIMPQDLLTAYLPGKKLSINIYNQAEFMVSYFLNYLISLISHDSINNDRYLALFFKGKRDTFSDVGESEIAGSIKTYLDHYMLSENRYKTVLMIVENEEKATFELNIGIENSDNVLAETTHLNKIFTDKTFESDRFKILKDVSLLSSMIPEIVTYINNEAQESIVYNYEEFAPFLVKIIPAMRLLNVKVLLPKSLQTLFKPKASVKITKKNSDSVSSIRLDDLLNFNWQIAIGNNFISIQDFQKLLNKATGLIKFKKNFIYVDEDDIEKLNKALAQDKKLSSSQLLQIALTEEYESAAIELSSEVKTLIKELSSQEEIALPNYINAELRPYQKRGYSWMYRNMRIGFGSIIADDMGLGKTLQVISLMQKLKEEDALKKRKVIVITPTGLLFNWQKELERFAPQLSSFIYHGVNRKLEDFKADVMLTSYGVLRSDIDDLKKNRWQLAIIDEAQNIKNHDTAQSKAVRQIHAATNIAMSGTPIENRLSEFWSIMEFANKGYLGSIKSFNEIYSRPIQILNDIDCVERFRKLTAPFMMRRLKSDKSIISDLPEKIEVNQYARLTKQQTVLYQKTLQLAMSNIEEIDDQDSQSLFKRQGLILQMILALKQICNHPALFLKNGDLNPELSGKSQMLLDIIDSIILNGEKVLIFTQFTEMAKILKSFIEKRFNVSPLFYHGGCTIKERQKMVDNFQTNPADKIFILSLKAAGTGLNLTAASHVIHYDLWWNPAVEAQATDRAYRIGQKSNVVVHRFITKNTFEEMINDMIERKKCLADMTITTGENWIGKLSNAELKDLFSW